MQNLLDRFCRYVRVDTQADESAKSYPSSAGQFDLGRMLVNELRAMGVKDAAADEFGVVLGTIPANNARPGPVMALIAHLDTSPETSGHGVKPIVHRDYD